MDRIRAALRRFRSDTRGAVAVESVLILPLLIWALMASFVYWDTFRTHNAHMKATYAVTDALSREMTGINTAYINGMHDVYRYMMQTDEPTWMRVTSVRYTEADDTFRVLWSRSTNGVRAPVMTNAMLANIRAQIPAMSNDDSVIIVETWREYTPLFRVGLEARVFTQFIVTRPRWLSPIPLTS
ncbi:MAG: TadE/TadG family type IV pilus assembly protein [Gemmobacter sp.]